MKKRNILYLLTIIIALFSFNSKVMAYEVLPDNGEINTSENASGEYYLNIKASNWKDDILFSNICSSSSTAITGKCILHCDDGTTKDHVSHAFASCSFKKYGLRNYTNNGIKGLQDFKDNLISNSKECGDKSCFSYIKENYCNNWNSTERICQDLAKIETSANVTPGEGENEVKEYTCMVTPKMNTDLTNDDISFNLVYNVEKNKLNIVSKTSSVIVNEKKGFVRSETNKFYMYPKGSSFAEFSQKYVNELKKSNYTCPKVSFCMKRKELVDGYYTWYADVGDNIDTAGCYSVQVIDESGESGKIQYDNDRETPIIDTTTLNKLDLCGEILTPDSVFTKILKYLVILVRISIPLILIGLGILDFLKAIFSGNEDGMKKAQAKFIKRVIIGVCIFLIPSILELILTIANSIWGNISTDFCGIIG